MRQLIPLSLWKQHPLGTQNWSVHGQACVYLSLENPSLLRTGTASKLQICKADHKVLLGHKLNDCEIELTIIFALLSLCILLHFNWIFVFVFCYVCHGSRKFLKIPVSIRSFFFLIPSILPSFHLLIWDAFDCTMRNNFMFLFVIMWGYCHLFYLESSSHIQMNMWA